MPSRHCSGAVLAGGASRRFGGGRKGLALVGGQRVVDRVLGALGSITDEQMLIANDRLIRDAVLTVCSHGDVRTERGSIVGLHSALTHCREAVLVVAWDMPFVSAALLAELRRKGEALDSAIIPEGVRGPEPLCAYYPRSCLSIIDRQIEEGAMRLVDLIEALPDHTILSRSRVERFGSPDRLFANVNTADDLATAQRIGMTEVVVQPCSNVELV